MPRVHRHRLRGISPRRVIQLASAVFFNGYAAGFQKGTIFTGRAKAFCVPVLNCYSCPGAWGACPIGALQAVLGKHRFPFYVLGLLMLFGVVLGRAVCGLLCPFGLVQDLLHRIPTPKLRVPRKIDRPARWLKYVILVAIPLLAFAADGNGVIPPYFCKYLCPVGTLEGGLPHMLFTSALRELAGTLFQWKVLVLLIILLAAVPIPRPFCRYLCPLGAFYGLFHKFSLFRLKLDRRKCVDCKACEHACPMTVEVTREPDSPECIRCGRCAEVCPTGALSCGFAAREAGKDSAKDGA